MALLLRRAIDTYVGERLQRREICRTSAATYRVVLTGFSDAIGKEVRTDQLTRSDLRAWWAGLRISPRSQRARLSCVRTFCGWCVDRRLMRSDPTAGIRSPRVPRALPIVLRPPQITATLAACPDERTTLIVILQLQLGLRAAEVANLRTSDVDLAGMQLRVLGKGGREDLAPITLELQQVLIPWMRQLDGEGPLVRRYQGGNKWLALSPAYVGVLVRRAMIDAGVKLRRGDGLSGHALRRVAITDVAKAGAPIPTLQAFSRHASPLSLQPYIAMTVGAELRQVVDGRRYLTPG